MRGRVAPQAEVAGRGDQPLAEVPVPDAVDHHPGRQRVLGSAIACGQLEPAAAFLESGAARDRRARGGTAAGPPCPGRPGLPRTKTCGSTGLGASFITMARRGAAGWVAFSLLDRAVERGECCPCAGSGSSSIVSRPVGDRQRPRSVHAGRRRSDSHSRLGQGLRRSAAFCSRASSWAKSATYRATTSSMFAGAEPSTGSGDQRMNSPGAFASFLGSAAVSSRRTSSAFAAKSRCGQRGERVPGGQRPGRSPWRSPRGADSRASSRPGAAGRRACRPGHAPPAGRLRSSNLQVVCGLQVPGEPLGEVLLDLVPPRRQEGVARLLRRLELPPELGRPGRRPRSPATPAAAGLPARPSWRRRRRANSSRRSGSGRTCGRGSERQVTVRPSRPRQTTSIRSSMISF